MEFVITGFALLLLGVALGIKFEGKSYRNYLWHKANGLHRTAICLDDDLMQQKYFYYLVSEDEYLQLQVTKLVKASKEFQKAKDVRSGVRIVGDTGCEVLGKEG